MALLDLVYSVKCQEKTLERKTFLMKKASNVSIYINTNI